MITDLREDAKGLPEMPRGRKWDTEARMRGRSDPDMDNTKT